MKTFENITFKWTFRDYQQRVLNNASKYLDDGKINIVAAPGSGKTILGLELIKRLNNPCIILSPTTTIKHQWKERFEESFLSDNMKIDDYVSFDLNKIKLLNSITYQALYSAINKLKSNEEDGEFDYSKIELFKLMKENNIKTICLDEAHHLQNEWQRSLEKFIKGLDKDVKIVSLTATPPYDANGNDWDRYISVCGEIDEEIFVPELVKQKNLCPHQDYIYFNYPTDEEIKSIEDYKQKAYSFLEEIKEEPYFIDAYNFINKDHKNDEETEKLYENVEGTVGLLVLYEYLKMPINKKVVKKVTTTNKLPEFSIEIANKAIECMCINSYLSDENKEKLINKLKNRGLYEKKQVSLCLNDKLVKHLVSSVGKLNSILEIVKAETSNLQDKLRMLILTDYINKESTENIGTDNKLDSINLVNIFEKIRRENITNKIGVLSGTLVILPNDCESYLKEKYENKYTTKKLTSDYSIYKFKLDNKEKVNLVSNLFEKGIITVLIGTKSLLGEGWDSPCINSIILASFVGSFMLSNQMRGRAIRVYKNDPNKVSNIWHLVTLEPNYKFVKENGETYEETTKVTSDFEIVKRRFNSFVGPNIKNGYIESGIDRILLYNPPYTEIDVIKMNEATIELSKNREALIDVWDKALVNSSDIRHQNQIPANRGISPLVIYNPVKFIIFVIIEILLITLMVSLMTKEVTTSLMENTFNALAGVATFFALAIFTFILLKIIKKYVKNMSPLKSIRNMGTALLKVLKDESIIESTSARVYAGKFTDITENNDMKEIIWMCLGRCTTHEKNLFKDAIVELFSPIENPRYLIIRKNILKQHDYRISFACPSVIGKKKELVERFSKELKKRMTEFDFVYTRNEEGRKLILKCRKKSYISYGRGKVKEKQIVNYYK